MWSKEEFYAFRGLTYQTHTKSVHNQYTVSEAHVAHHLEQFFFYVQGSQCTLYKTVSKLRPRIPIYDATLIYRRNKVGTI